MREIKFRAWDKKKNKMFVVKILNIFTQFLNPNNGKKYSISDGRGWTCKNPTELMQFTGLKDKNGKEIFEGDIIEINFGIEKRIGVVRETEGSFEIGDMKDKDKFLFSAIREEIIKIKGNIYENPELLEDDTTRTQVKELKNE